MIEMTTAEIAEVVGGVAHGEATVTGGAFVDTRTPEAGGLFVAIAGERVDGHDFAADAAAAGAVAALGSRPTELPTVVVDDVTAALGVLARHVVDQLVDVVVLAMTGSQGKTGTKDYLAHLLAEAGPTVATRGNFNNELGVPLTVLRATPETRYLVVEMGARGVGHIARLCEIAPPHVAAVLNVGTAHIGEFGSREAIAVAKGEIVEALAPDGTAVLNADDDLVAAMASRTSATVTTFGSGRADVAVREITTDEIGRPVLRGRPPRVRCHRAPRADRRLPVAQRRGRGGHGARCRPRPRRGRRLPGRRHPGQPVADGADRAARRPGRAQRRLQRQPRVHAGRPRDARGHRVPQRSTYGRGPRRDVRARCRHGRGPPRGGPYAAEVGVDVVVTVGAAAGVISDGFDAVPGGGVTVPTVGRDAAADWLRHNVSAADVVLVKASRGAALELLAEVLLTESGTEGSSTR